MDEKRILRIPLLGLQLSKQRLLPLSQSERVHSIFSFRRCPMVLQRKVTNTIVFGSRFFPLLRAHPPSSFRSVPCLFQTRECYKRNVNKDFTYWGLKMINIITTGMRVKSMHNNQSRRTKEEEEDELEEEEKIDFRRVSCL